MSPGALEDFEHFRQFLHADKAVLDGREREWWAKGATLSLRLAGTLAYIAWAIRNGGRADAMEQASSWGLLFTVA